MKSKPSRIPLVLLAVLLAGCGTRPVGSLATAKLDAPLAGTYASSLDRPTVLDERRTPSVTVHTTPGEVSDSQAVGGAEPRSGQDEEQPLEPLEADDTGAPERPLDSDVLVADKVVDPDMPIESRAYAAASRTDDNGKAVSASYYDDGPVYLTPNYFPILMPGSPAPMPAFTPATVDMGKVPTDAFAELARLGRLREAKRGFWSFLFGYSFPKITAATARGYLASGKDVYVGPDGGFFHFDRTYKKHTATATIDAMLPELQEAALTREAQAVREANINNRSKVLPEFNRTFDITKFVLLEMIVGGYSYNGSPVRRCMVTAYNYYDTPAIRKEIAKYWDDNPNCTAGQLRQQTCRVLGNKFAGLANSVNYLAERPSVYADAQAIPGLRDPRPSSVSFVAHEADVQYNKDVIRELARTAPALLSSTIYP